MALSRRSALIALSLLGGGLGCSPAQQAATPTPSAEPWFNQRPLDPARSNILVFMPSTTQTREVWQALSDELHAEFNLIPIEVPAGVSRSLLGAAMERYRPSCVILMNNPTLAAYREFQNTMPSAHGFPPAVVVMSSFLEEQYASVANATGICYELPAVTLFSNLRSLLTKDIRRVGTIYRPSFRHFTARQTELARGENFSLVGIEVGAQPSAAEIEWAIRELKSQADALWIQNDNILLTPELISRGWSSELQRRPRLPSIVGAAPLVSTAHSFGTFAVVPDHTALGVQAAGMVFELSENEWQIAEAGVQLPLSTKTVMDFNQAEEFFELRQGALARVDRVLR